MADVVVSVPRAKWAAWLREGCLPGQSSRQFYAFDLGAVERPPVEPGDRVYVVAWDRLRGYAPLVRMDSGADGVALIRGDGAVAVTLPEPVKSFPAWKLRWWPRETEVPFPEWKSENVVKETKRLQHAALAYAQVVSRPLTDDAFAVQLEAARAEIASHNALSWTQAGGKREVIIIRCGAGIGGGRLCMKNRGHDDECGAGGR